MALLTPRAVLCCAKALKRPRLKSSSAMVPGLGVRFESEELLVCPQFHQTGWTIMSVISDPPLLGRRMVTVYIGTHLPIYINPRSRTTIVLIAFTEPPLFFH